MCADVPAWSPKDIKALQRSAGNQAVASLLRPAPRRSVQRALGVELEDSHWTVVADKGVAIGKGTPVIDRPQFELQAEFGGGTRTNLEIVTKPPGVDEASFPGMIADMGKLIAELDARQAGGPFKASVLTGGKAGFTIHPGPKPFSPFTQVTVGVPLAAMATFFDLLKGGAAAVSAPGDQSRANVAKTLELDDKPSDKLLGFITLLGHYMLEGRSKSTFPKGSFGALAKTDLSEVFMWLPSAERKAIRSHIDKWVAAIAGLALASDTYAAKGGLPKDYDPAKQSVLGPSYYDPQADLPPMTVTTTREEWLKALVSTKEKGEDEEKGRDILSVKGKLAAPDTPEMAGMDPKEKEALKLGKDVVETGPFENRRPAEMAAIKRRKLKASKDDQLPIIEKFIADMKDLQAGFGALGSKRDLVDYIGETGPDAALHRSVIVEIRRPSGGTWDEQATNVFDALTKAINKHAPAVAQGPRFKSELPAPPQQAPAPQPVVTATQTAAKLADKAEKDLEEVLS